MPTPRTLSYRDGYLPALRFEVVTQRCRQRRCHVPGEHEIVLFRGERDAVTVRLLLIHLQHVGMLGDVLEARQYTPLTSPKQRPVFAEPRLLRR